MGAGISGSICTLATSLLRPGQVLQSVAYFTARVRDDPDALRRQSDYLDALASHSPLVRIVDGRFQEKERRCRACGNQWTGLRGKETDANIAISLLEDAVADPSRHGPPKGVADGFIHVGIDKVRNAQLPEQVVIGTGVALSRPKYWT